MRGDCRGRCGGERCSAERPRFGTAGCSAPPSARVRGKLRPAHSVGAAAPTAAGPPDEALQRCILSFAARMWLSASSLPSARSTLLRAVLPAGGGVPAAGQREGLRQVQRAALRTRRRSAGGGETSWGQEGCGACRPLRVIDLPGFGSRFVGN